MLDCQKKNFMEKKINEVDKINAQIAELISRRENEMKKERVNVLAKMKADIKLYGFKTTDFRGLLATRAKRSDGKNLKKT